jgi:hypothetical protein
MDALGWASEHGFKLRLPNRVVITKVRDPDALREVFKAAFPPRWIRQEIDRHSAPPFGGAARSGRARPFDPFITRLPHAVELTWPDTALLLDALRTTEAFDYEVNP